MRSAEERILVLFPFLGECDRVRDAGEYLRQRLVFSPGSHVSNCLLSGSEEVPSPTTPKPMTGRKKCVLEKLTST